MNPRIGWRSITKVLAALLLFANLTSCRTTPVRRAPDSAAIAIRNNAASLLHDLLSNEENVSKLLLIKREREELNQLIKSISSSAAAGRKALERLTNEDVTLNLTSLDLPPGEQATREAIARTRGGELIRAFGADFETKLLLTQVEALSYGEHLAKIAALHEPSPARARVFTDIEFQMHRWHGEALGMLRGSAGKPAR